MPKISKGRITGCPKIMRCPNLMSVAHPAIIPCKGVVDTRVSEVISCPNVLIQEASNLSFHPGLGNYFEFQMNIYFEKNQYQLQINVRKDHHS